MAQDLETVSQYAYGLDPFVVMGLATTGFGALGWLVGPALGGALWGTLNKGTRAEFQMVSAVLSFHFGLAIHVAF